MTRLEGDHAALLAELADRDRGRRRVEVDPNERGPVADPRPQSIGTVEEPVDRGLNDREVRVYGPPINTFREGVDFTRTWRVATDRGTFDVAYSVDRTPEARTHTVLVSRVSNDDDANGSEDDP